MLNDLRIAVLSSQRAPALEALLAHPRADVVAVLRRTHVPRLGQRSAYDAELAALLTRLDVDYVFCLGYLYVLTEPMLAAFPGRIVNIHDSDLTRPFRYPGLHATRDAIVAGERVTRSTLHVVNEELDGGPVLCVSDAYPVAPFVREAVRAGANDIVRAYAYAHREWIIRDAWPRLVAQAVDKLAVTEAIA